MLRVQLSVKDESVLSFTPLNSWPNHQPKSYSMKKFIASIALFVAIGAASNISAQDYKTALGIRLSSSQAMVNNSVSIKHFLNEKTAIEGLLSFGDPLSIGALVEIHKPLGGTSGIKWFYGGGAYLGFVKKTNTETGHTSTDPNFGGMGVLGLVSTVCLLTTRPPFLYMPILVSTSYSRLGVVRVPCPSVNLTLPSR